MQPTANQIKMVVARGLPRDAKSVLKIIGNFQNHEKSCKKVACLCHKLVDKIKNSDILKNKVGFLETVTDDFKQKKDEEQVELLNNNQKNKIGA